MSLFEQLYKSVMVNEAGYNPYDQGYETYNGINRGFHPAWRGWPAIDAIKARRPIKRAERFAELEPAAKEFYLQYWKNAGLDILKLQNLKIAELLVDMATQHGRWARIVNAGLYSKSPFDTTIPNRIGEAEYRMMNSAPAVNYKKIADARLAYCKSVPLVNEGDRRGIINRAQKYVNDAIAYLKSSPGTSATALLLAGFFF